MRCHYEVLGVPQNVTDQDLKSAYRQQALKWHPDKNIDNQEEATEAFKLVKLAYEVLSDPNERAYYDRNRDLILRNKEIYEERALVDVFQYFTTTCFKGYSDSDEGFFAVYRKIFEDVAAEEDQDLPSFGDEGSDYEEVVREFYQSWESFCSRLEFEWIFAHDVTQYRDRRTARYVKKENQKLQDAARKERTSNVRNLVLFVKKRDPRVRAHLLELQEKQEASKRHRDSQREQQKLEKLKKIEEFQEAEWMPLDELEKQLDALEAEHEKAQLGGDEEDTLFCIACDKLFMSIKSFENHVRSKKHKQNEELLKREMLEEEENLNAEKLDSVEEESVVESVSVEEAGDADLPEAVISDEFSSNDKRNTKNKRKNKKKRAFLANLNGSDSDEKTTEVLRLSPEVSDDSDDFLKKDGRRKKQVVKAEDSKKKKKAAAEKLAAKNGDAGQNENPSVPTEDRSPSPTPERAKMSKAKAAKGTKAKKTVAEPVGNVCATCGEKFASRNKMFEHLERKKHSQYLPK